MAVLGPSRRRHAPEELQACVQKPGPRGGRPTTAAPCRGPVPAVRFGASALGDGIPGSGPQAAWRAGAGSVLVLSRRKYFPGVS